MAKCEVCGNDYDKAFTVTMGGRAYIRLLQMRDPSPSSFMLPLRLQGRWTRGRKRRHDLLLRHCAKEAGVVGLEDRL